MLPVLRLEGLTQLSRGVVQQRHQHDVLACAQIRTTDLAEPLGDQLVDLPVGLAFPQRRHRLGQRVDERVHVGRVQVVLLVPGGRGQHDVAIQTGRAHPEIQDRHQIQLALLGHLLGRAHLGRTHGVAGITEHRVLRAQQVLQEVLVPLAAGTQDVRTPDEQVAREVLRILGIITAHALRAVLQATHQILHRILTGLLGGIDDFQRVVLQLRCRRQPAHALGAGVEVDQRQRLHRLLVGRRCQDLAHAQLLVPVLARVRIEEARAVHLARRTRPVQTEGQRCPAELRTQLLLAHIVRPAATALTHAAAHHQQVDDAAVGHVGMEPVVQTRTDDHHAATMRVMRVLRELTRHLRHQLGTHARVLLLPCRRAGNIVVIGLGHVLAAQPLVHAIVGHLQVVDGGHQAFAAIGQLHALDRHVARQQVVLLATEVAEVHGLHVVVHALQAQHRIDFPAAAAIALLQVPAPHLAGARLVLAPAEANRAVGRHHVTGQRIHQHRLPFGVVGLAQVLGQVRGTQEVVRHQLAVVFLQRHQHRHVGVLLQVIHEVRRRVVAVELGQHHVTHGQCQRSVRPLTRGQPHIAELHHLAVVGRDRHRLGALVTHLGVEMGIRRAGHRHVRAPHHQVTGVVPVGRLGHVGLLAPHLWAGRRQVAVPVIEAQTGAPDQAQVAGPRGIADHRHGWNGREAHHPVRTILLDGQRVGRRNDLGSRVPVSTHEAAQAAHALVAARLHRILTDRLPGRDRILRLPGLAPHLHQLAPDHRVLDALRRVHVPAVGSTPRTAARLMVGQVRARARVVGLLGFPGDQPALHVDLPAARAGTVDPVSGARNLVVLPAGTVGVLPGTVFLNHGTMAFGEGRTHPGKEFQPIQKMTHRRYLLFRAAGLRRPCSKTTQQGVRAPLRA